MKTRFSSRFWVTTALAVSMAAASLPIAPAQAMPARPIGLNEATPSLVESVQYRRRYVRARRGNRAAGAAIALGVLGLAAGAAIAAQRRDRYYDEPSYYGGGYGYYSAPPAYYYNPRPRYYGQRYSAPRYYGGQQRQYYGGQRWQGGQPWQGDGHYGSGK